MNYLLFRNSCLKIRTLPDFLTAQVLEILQEPYVCVCVCVFKVISGFRMILQSFSFSDS